MNSKHYSYFNQKMNEVHTQFVWWVSGLECHDDVALSCGAAAVLPFHHHGQICWVQRHPYIGDGEVFLKGIVIVRLKFHVWITGRVSHRVEVQIAEPL